MVQDMLEREEVGGGTWRSGMRDAATPKKAGVGFVIGEISGLRHNHPTREIQCPAIPTHDARSLSASGITHTYPPIDAEKKKYFEVALY